MGEAGWVVEADGIGARVAERGRSRLIERVSRHEPASRRIEPPRAHVIEAGRVSQLSGISEVRRDRRAVTCSDFAVGAVPETGAHPTAGIELGADRFLAVTGEGERAVVGLHDVERTETVDQFVRAKQKQARRRGRRLPEEARRAALGPRLQQPIAVVGVAAGHGGDGRGDKAVKRVVGEGVALSDLGSAQAAD